VRTGDTADNHDPEVAMTTNEPTYDGQPDEPAPEVPDQPVEAEAPDVEDADEAAERMNAAYDAGGETGLPVTSGEDVGDDG
jgi:hypothetical protein